MRACVYVSARPATSVLRSMKESGMQCRVVTLAEAIWAIEADTPAVIIIEAGPAQIAVLRQCALSRPDDAILIAVAEQRDKDLRIALLRAGADACLDLPLSVREVAALIEALTRRLKPTRPTAAPPLPTGDGGHPLIITRNSRRAAYQGRELALTAGDWELLSLLAEARPVARETLQRSVGHGPVDGAVSRLRRKLAGCPVRVVCIRGVGYRLEGCFRVS